MERREKTKSQYLIIIYYVLLSSLLNEKISIFVEKIIRIVRLLLPHT